MSKFILYWQKSMQILKKSGVRGLYRKVKKVMFQSDVIYSIRYFVDLEPIELDKEACLMLKDSDQILLNWVVPEMGEGSGGHTTIFRFISHLENLGFHSRIYLHRSYNFVTDQQIRSFLKEKFPILDSRVEVYCSTDSITFAHATFATLWNTAYFVRKFHNTITKFYFVQDYEPYFFPQGSEYEFARNTYRFGFRGITAGDWLKNKLHDEFGMQTESFSFSCDTKIYHPQPKKDDVKRVFFYARPVTPRRDFELGLLALDLLCQKMPDVEVVFAGWDLNAYYFPFKYKSLGIITPQQLAEQYTQSDLCFVISNTNLSLVPLEVMACKSVAVCTDGPNSTWLVNEENSVLVDYDPIHMADAMAYYLTHPEALESKREKGYAFALTTSWEEEAKKVQGYILKAIEEDKKKIEL